ncbi:2OG-Fe(II) oxygenase [Marinobacter bohaiensis]|uniref:2OG-Fe(II) oxygenase n=1 Tax=Marinobacter bohaiensis TaxID=2201898 RepID=UPI000DAD70D6|nr:2OG-Fe(II) oxygenase [Marinobacter bohaiensis]
MSELPFDAAEARDLLAGRPPANLDLWLDDVAGQLAEFGWTSQSLLPHLSTETLSALRQEVETLNRTEALDRAGVGRGKDHAHDRSVRRDRIAWLNGETVAQGDLWRLLNALQQGLNQRLFIGLKRFECHYATYGAGDFYRRHLDSFRGRSSRIVSLVLYLNDDWRPEDGGLLQIYNRENPNEICGSVLPEAGRVALFMSEDIPHEVLTAQRTRYSIACWFRRDPIQGLAL